MPFGLKQNQINAINSIFKEYNTIERVIIYGSRAKGTYKPGSDIDLVIEGNDLTFSELMSVENKLDDLLLPYKIDLSQKNSISSEELLGHIQRVGKVFYEKKK
jgi:predicted nucleotidyltransferase